MPVVGVWTDPQVTLMGTDLSDYVRSVALARETASAEQTAMGDSARTHVSGLDSWSVEMDLVQITDIVDAAIFPLISTTSDVTLTIFENSGTTGSVAPLHYGDVIVTNYVPFSQAVGDFMTCRLSLVGASTYGRDTSTS